MAENAVTFLMMARFLDSRLRGNDRGEFASHSPPPSPVDVGERRYSASGRAEGRSPSASFFLSPMNGGQRGLMALGTKSDGVWKSVLGVVEA